MSETLTKFIIYSIVGTILHFTYKLSKKNIVVGIFSAVNESTWEHIKILLTPIFFFNTFKYVLGDQSNYFLMLLTELLTAIIGIIFLSELKNKLFGNKLPILNVVLFYIVAFMCSLFGYTVRKIPISNFVNIVSLFGCIIIYVVYILFTVCAPKKEIFKDPVTGSYGISCVNNNQ